MDASAFNDSIGFEVDRDRISLPLYGAIILAAVYLLYFLVGVTTNVATLGKLWCCKQAGDRSKVRAVDIAISSLAVADLLIVIVLLPEKFHVELYQAWLLGSFVCSLTIYAEALTVIVSLLTLIAAAILLCAARRNAAYDGRSYAVRTSAGIGAQWLLAAVVSVGWLLTADFHDGVHGQACMQAGFARHLLEVIAVALHCVLYTAFCCAFASKTDGEEGDAATVHMATKVVLAIAVFKTICWLPFHLLIIVEMFVYVSTPRIVWILILTWTLTTSVVNYFICKAYGYFTV